MARSEAEIPVVTPYFGAPSIETVNAVFIDSVFSRACIERPRWATRSLGSATQIIPFALSMKLTISGVTISAAQIRSPSFSRSSSSATTTNLPLRRSSIACCTVPNAMGET